MAGWWLVTAVFSLFLIFAVIGIVLSLKSGIHPEDAKEIDENPADESLDNQKKTGSL